MSVALAGGSAGLEREAPPGTRVDLVYQDAEGRMSRRRVEVVRWSRARGGLAYLRAYCSLREEERTFRGDRIVQWRVVERELPPSRPAEVFVPLAPAPRSRAAPPAVVTAPVCAPSGAPPAATPARRHGSGLLSVSGVAVTIALVRALFSAGEAPRPAYVPAPPVAVVVPAPRPAPKPAPRPAPKPAPRPAPVPSPDPAPDPLPAPVPAPGGRAVAFRAATGIESPPLEAIYRGADLDGNDALDWDELAAFQSWLDRTYAYRANRLALRPDEFLAQGGGDCEDWALVTSGLLRWWGWDPYVGTFAPSDGAVGHAVCLVRLAARPTRYRWWSVDDDGTLGGYSVKAGWYVPVDYEKVGELTNAVDGWSLRAIRDPEAIYGKEM